jgi:hypothetical protein
MPFGLQNAPATFARMMRKLKLHELSAVSFFDDILLGMRHWEALLQALRLIFLRLRSFGLTARPCKVYAGFQELEFLGHTISVGHIRPEKGKVNKILALKKPTTKKQVRSIIGLLSYYRRYVPHFATITAPLTDLTKGNVQKKVIWSDDCQRCLDNVQAALNKFPVLLLPSLTENFIMRTDASSVGMGEHVCSRAKRVFYTQYSLRARNSRQLRKSIPPLKGNVSPLFGVWRSLLDF